jgi:hypothetical protein
LRKIQVPELTPDTIPTLNNLFESLSINAITPSSNESYGYEPVINTSRWGPIQQKCPELRNHYYAAQTNRCQDQYLISDNVLYKKSHHNYLVCVPLSMRRDLISRFHDATIAGHFGPEKTYHHMNKYVTWTKMKSDIKKYIDGCRLCQLYKTKNQVRAPYRITTIPDHPFHTISLDIVGPIPATFHGYTNILVIQDVLTRWIDFIPIRIANSPTIVDKLKLHVFRYGVPQKIITDQGSIFMGGLFDELCTTFGVRHIDTTPYRPQANGMNERSHATLHRLLGILQRDKLHKSAWPELCPLIAYIHNTMYHVTIKRSPYEALFGRVSSETPFGIPQMSNFLDEDVETWLDITTETLMLLNEEIKTIIADMRHTALDRANIGTKIPEFLVGDQIIVRRNSAKGYDRKWGPKYSDPYQITRKITDLILEYVDEKGDTKTIHVDHVKRFHPATPAVQISSADSNLPIDVQPISILPAVQPPVTQTIVAVPIPSTITAHVHPAPLPMPDALPHSQLPSQIPVLTPVATPPRPGILNALRSRFGRTLRSTQTPAFHYPKP